MKEMQEEKLKLPAVRSTGGQTRYGALTGHLRVGKPCSVQMHADRSL